MALVKAECDTCGDIETLSRFMTLRLNPQVIGMDTYTFRCPVCKMVQSTKAESWVIDVLLSVGVPVVTWNFPAELTEAHEGDPITPDDLIDFHNSIDDEIARLTSP